MGLIDRLLFFIEVRGPVEVGPGFHVGPFSRIWAPRNLSFGSDVYVGKHVTIEVDGSIGDGVLIANNVGIVGRRDHDMSEMGTVIRRARWVGDWPDSLSSGVEIGSDVWIGFGAIVLSGVCIGDSAVVAAGAVVVSDVPENSVVAGNPARVVRARFPREDFERHWDGLLRAGFRRSVRGA